MSATHAARAATRAMRTGARDERRVVRMSEIVACRKTVAPDPLFSNPYVRYEQRATDRDSMLAAIRVGDAKTFKTLARQRDVSAVVSAGSEECSAARQLMPVSWRFGSVCVSLLDSLTPP